MRGERSGDAAAIVAGAAGLERAGLDLGRQMAFLQRQQASAVKHDIGVGNAAIAGDRGRRARQFLAEAAEQRAAGVVFGLPFRGADPAVAVAGAAVLEMEGVQHAVADEPMRARRFELRIGTVAVERAVQFARQFAFDLEMRRVAFHRNRRSIGDSRLSRHVLLHRSLPDRSSLHRKDTITIHRRRRQAKSLQCQNRDV